MKPIVIGTAGHIDHGKTALVRALTGIDTDRLKEEKQRGISIELGFAPFNLPEGQKAAIVDVPGHERFIRHMLAGAFGIDMVLLVIASDEGIMPQTKEHLDIIELLGVDKGIVVLTKIDLVDEEWLLLVEEDVREYLAKSILRNAPIVAVSAITGKGLPELIKEISEMAKGVQEKPFIGEARIPIDRVFTMSGFGTVVTGTLWSGHLKVGDSMELMPVKKLVRIRNLQVHNEKVAEARAGQRVAINLQGIELSEIRRGYWLSTPGYLIPSYRVDTRLHLLQSCSKTVKNWTRIRFHLGTDEAMGRIVLLDRDELNPGEEAYAQIVLEKPVVGQKADRFVIRYYSPVTTIGGGVIIDPNAPKQKRFREEVLEDLVMKEEGSLYDVLLHELEHGTTMILSLDELTKKSAAPTEDVKMELLQLVEDERVLDLKDQGYISCRLLEQLKAPVVESLEKHHRRYPLRAGYPKEDMRSRLFKKIDQKAFNLILKFWEQEGVLVNKNNQLSLNGFKAEPQGEQVEWIMAIMKAFIEQPFAPPSLDEIRNHLKLGETEFNELISYLMNDGRLIKISQDTTFSAEAINQGKQILNAHFEKEKELTLAAARDLFNTSRKYTLPLVEYYDRTRFTKRVGDVRFKA